MKNEQVSLNVTARYLSYARIRDRNALCRELRWWAGQHEPDSPMAEGFRSAVNIFTRHLFEGAFLYEISAEERAEIEGACLGEISTEEVDRAEDQLSRLVHQATRE